jgi:hypothetical protein
MLRTRFTLCSPICTGTADRPANPPVLSIFYGYPPQLIARWCGVSIATATAYKRGVRKPSRQALRLFVLHRDELVLDAEWRGFHIRRGAIVDPAGNVTTRAQLEGYAMILQWVAHWASCDPKIRREYNDLLKRA